MTSPDPPVPYPVAVRELLRATLLDAMREQLRERPWAEVTMAEVARAGGVSRQTLYKEFRSRQDFAQAYVLREVDSFLTAVEEAVTANLDDPATALAAAFDVFLAAAAEDPLVRTLVAGDGGDELLPLITTQGQPVLQHATDRLAALMIAHWPQLGEAQARLLAETVVRLGISYTALPGIDAPLSGASVGSLLGPYLDRALSGTTT